MAIDDIQIFELVAFCFERFCIVSMMFLSSEVPVNWFFLESILLNLAALLWRLLERQPLFDNGIFPKSIDVVSRVERVTLLSMAIFGVGHWMWLLACVIFVPTNLIYLGCFIAKLSQKLYGQISKIEVKTMQVEAEIQANPKEGISASKQNQTSTITTENLDHTELKTIINESNVSPSSSEEIDEINIHQGSDENGEKLKETEDRFDNKGDKADELHGFVFVEELLFSRSEEEEEAKELHESVHGEELTSREEEEEEEEEEEKATIEDYHCLTSKLYFETQSLRADFDGMRAELIDLYRDWNKELKIIKKEHKEQLRNFEEGKKEKTEGKLCATTAFSEEVHQSIVREREESCRKSLEEAKNDLAAKLCATTALSEVHQSLVREREESCRKLEEAKNDLAAKLCATTALLEISQSLLREKEESCRRVEAEKNDLAAKLCAATASSELYRGLLHDLGY